MQHPEHQYLDLLSQILQTGDKRIDRTGVGTLSLFGTTARFDLSRGEIPLLTTKRVYWKTAVKEMLWFLTGDTNIRSLLKENVRIWTDWPLAKYRQSGEDGAESISQEVFEQRVLNDDAFAATWGELGPVYGKQWRRWVGADGREYDQIAGLVQMLRTNPSSRRMLFHAWNVPEIGQMSLPPCQVYLASSTVQNGGTPGVEPSQNSVPVQFHKQLEGGVIFHRKRGRPQAGKNRRQRLTISSMLIRGGIQKQSEPPGEWTFVNRKVSVSVRVVCKKSRVGSGSARFALNHLQLIPTKRVHVAPATGNAIQAAHEHISFVMRERIGSNDKSLPVAIIKRSFCLFSNTSS